jgi:hypothetical protein
VFYDKGNYTTVKDLPLAYALFNLAASYNPSEKLYAENRDRELRGLEKSGQVALGQEYTRRLAHTNDIRATILEIIKPKAKASATSK